MYEELKDIVIEVPKGRHPGTTPLPGPYTTLDKLYKDGWWITEIFGSQAVLAHRLSSGACKYPRFRVVYKTIDLRTVSKKALTKIKKVQNEQWKKYNRVLTTGDKRYRIKENGKI